MKVIGLTGGIASGKSTVAGILASLGARVIDADKIAREVVEPGKPAWEEIKSVFGEEYLRPDGTVDRRALGSLVFQDPEAREKLNAITHPRIKEEIARRLEACRREDPAGVVVVEAALLLEAGMERTVDEVWVVTAPEEVRLKRLMERDNLSREEARRRIKAQWPEEERLRFASRVIDTGKDLAATVQEVRALWQQLWERNKGEG
ncbi:MAG: dephospho-CoA kinase [Thermoanaerobacteraceae bacterium]|uniref:dephospho-CoA kinase n=1 Tax=Thermanaeromonas sp. C210 TaxID=2731925 RepID=UPI00155B8DE9|nr:dephospho-CoA kinase [Thermanaeromonas sp. C210]MBE3582319.1 dephospho-CoA kinase [Thermoanaerobacteraceae bacterium]GFN22456.1 dephospho-CoA kinase [Thermanaeromonas sp. C210]